MNVISPLAALTADAHKSLARFNRGRLNLRLPHAHWRDALAEEYEMRLLEGNLIERERAAVAAEAREAPTTPDEFVAWFERLRESGPGQGDPLFPWLATTASHDEMRWFLLQEVAGEAGFEDLVAMTQVRLPVQAKLELARNYWDEMGRGNDGGMHGPMLARLAEEFELQPQIDDIVWESLALANLMLALAANRRFTYQSVGALGVIEMTSPTRVGHVDRGLERLGVSPKVRRYFTIHATLDVRHSQDWNREVLHSLVAADPSVAVPIAEGALMRLTAGARCFDRYRQHFAI